MTGHMTCVLHYMTSNARLLYILLSIWLSFHFTAQQKFGIKTAGLDEKCTAMQMLVVYAKDLKEGFADFAEPVRDAVF